MAGEFAEIEDALKDYFDALYYCDTEKLERVFHAEAVYATADESPPLIRRMPEYSKVVKERVSPASRGEARRDFIDAIEFAGDNTAQARVRCSIGPRNFVDFLTFIRCDGRWRIIAKVFQIIENKEHPETA
ncbi:MAG: nuclear transport factor 2 family protein [Parvularculaceae bacterium]